MIISVVISDTWDEYSAANRAFYSFDMAYAYLREIEKNGGSYRIIHIELEG